MIHSGTSSVKDLIGDANESLTLRKDLAQTIKLERKKRGDLNLAEAAKQIGVSASTLSRIENVQLMPKWNTLADICHWLDISIDRFSPAADPALQMKDTLSSVEVHLRADKNLSPEAAEDLIKMFGQFYELHVNKSKAKPS